MAARALLNTPRAIRPTPLLRPSTSRALSQTSRLSLKESASADPDAEAFDRHKQDSLSKQKQGKGHWKPELASVSEESVRADREGGPRSSDPESIRRLQERTKGSAEETAKKGTSMKDGL